MDTTHACSPSLCNKTRNSLLSSGRAQLHWRACASIQDFSTFGYAWCRGAAKSLQKLNFQRNQKGIGPLCAFSFALPRFSTIHRVSSWHKFVNVIVTVVRQWWSAGVLIRRFWPALLHNVPSSQCFFWVLPLSVICITLPIGCILDCILRQSLDHSLHQSMALLKRLNTVQFLLYFSSGKQTATNLQRNMKKIGCSVSQFKFSASCLN